MVEFDVLDAEASDIECEPFLRVGIRASENIDIPENRLELEEDVKDKFGYIERRVFSAIKEGPAVHENIVFLVKISPAETWRSINRKVEGFMEFAEEDERIDDPGRDVSITLDAGDVERIIREEEEGFRR
jgi:hypothetical protein